MDVGSLVSAVLRGPFTERARREVAFCVLTLPFGVFIPLAGFFVTVDAGLLLRSGPPWVSGGDPSGLAVAAAVGVAAALTVLLVTTGAVRLADGPGWRAVAYLLLKLPLTLLELYALAVFWGAGLANLTYPFWWQSVRNHPPGTHLSAVPVITPFGWFGQGQFTVATFPGTLAVFAAGAGMLLAAPWVTRAMVAADRRLIRGLLSPESSARRLADLERTRALAVDDAAARLRRLERDLHDGAQIRLATLAMNLGMAKKKLGNSGAVPDADAARELVDAALLGARDALGELRELARGIHPPVLDNGLPDALASLAAGSAIPAQLACRLPTRPAPAIEAIAYFCTAELLANAAKHSAANTIKIDLSERAGRLTLTVADDGRGGADLPLTAA
ncbi:MAG TPA: sensor domain-containing protein [Streptosporangiaceae bacterium]|jgi:signal transduction histidine kinase